MMPTEMVGGIMHPKAIGRIYHQSEYAIQPHLMLDVFDRPLDMSKQWFVIMGGMTSPAPSIEQDVPHHPCEARRRRSARASLSEYLETPTLTSKSRHMKKNEIIPMSTQNCTQPLKAGYLEQLIGIDIERLAALRLPCLLQLIQKVIHRHPP